MSELTRIRRGDILLVLLVLLCSAFLLMTSARGGGALVAEITQDGALIRTIALTGLKEPVTVRVTGTYENLIVAQDGTVRVAEATCPHQTCVRTGTLRRAGQSAVCVENRMVLSIRGDREVDAVAR